MSAENPTCAEFFREFQPGWQEISRDHIHAAQSEQPSEHQTDRSLACHQNKIAAQKRQSMDRLQHRVDRLQHRAFEEAVSAWYFDDPRKNKGHNADIFGVAAAGLLEARSDAGAIVLHALR